MADSLQPPDDKRLFLLLQDTGLDSGKAYTFVQELRTMAAENIIARYESKLEAHTAHMGSKLDAQTATLDARTASLSALMDARLDAHNAKLDARNATLDARTASLSSRITVLAWVIGVAFALLVALNFLPAPVP